jgi:hypothetical protein
MKRCLLGILFLLVLAGIASGNIAVIGGLAHEHTADRGDTYGGTIRVRNEGQEPCEIRIYQTDYLFQASGETFYGDPGTSPRSNADWLTINPRWLTIPARSTASIRYEVKVPDDEGLSGSYWSMVMVEPNIVSSQVITGEDGKGRMGVRTLIRYGVQIVTDIGDAGTREIRFVDTRLVARAGRKLLEIDLENTGNTWLSPTFSVELYDEQGAHALRLDGEQRRVYPGCSVRHTIDVTGVPNGKYKALAIVDNRDEYVFGAQYDLWID